MGVTSAIVHSASVRRATRDLATTTPRRLNLRSLRRGVTQWLGGGQRRASASASAPLLLQLLGLNWAVALVVGLVVLLVSALLLVLHGRQGLASLRRAWNRSRREEQTLERNRALEQTLGRLHQQRDELELALSSSAHQIGEFKALLRPRCGLLASVLVPAEQREEFVCSERRASLHPNPNPSPSPSRNPSRNPDPNLHPNPKQARLAALAQAGRVPLAAARRAQLEARAGLAPLARAVLGGLRAVRGNSAC